MKIENTKYKPLLQCERSESRSESKGSKSTFEKKDVWEPNMLPGRCSCPRFGRSDERTTNRADEWGFKRRWGAGQLGRLGYESGVMMVDSDAGTHTVRMHDPELTLHCSGEGRQQGKAGSAEVHTLNFGKLLRYQPSTFRYIIF